MPSIIIKITSGNPPTAEPDELRVDPGQDFEFEGDTAFTIEFEEESPDKGNPDKKRHSKTGKDKIKMKAKNKKGTYPYTILIGDQAVDPAIIIK